MTGNLRARPPAAAWRPAGSGGFGVGLSYCKSFKARPLRVTASKSGIGYSAGVKGARITKRADGRVQTTLSVPGYRPAATTTTSGNAKAAGRRKPPGPQAAANSAPLPGHRSTALPYPLPAVTPPLVLRAISPRSHCVRTASRSTGRFWAGSTGAIPLTFRGSSWPASISSIRPGRSTGTCTSPPPPIRPA